MYQSIPRLTSQAKPRENCLTGQISSQHNESAKPLKPGAKNWPNPPGNCLQNPTNTIKNETEIMK